MDGVTSGSTIGVLPMTGRPSCFTTSPAADTATEPVLGLHISPAAVWTALWSGGNDSNIICCCLTAVFSDSVRADCPNAEESEITVTDFTG